MIKIRIEYTGLNEIISGLNGFIRDLRNRKELMDKLKETQVERWQANFESRGGEYEEWQETSPEYQAVRVAEGFSPTPTLERSGRLLTHFTSQNEAGKTNNSAVRWEFFNRVAGRRGAYTVSHHTGYQLGKGARKHPVPARVLWDLDNQDEDRGATEIENWIDELAARHF